MKAVIMAGGKGTRIQDVAKDIPKPMLPIFGKPILEYQIESLKKNGITDIIFIIGYLGYVIKNYFGNGEKWNININYIIEDKPLGTAGALYYLKGKMSDDFILVFGDLILDIDWERFMKFHKAHGASLTLFAHPNAHPYDSDVLVTDDKSNLIRIEYKNIKRNFYYYNLVNAGVYCISHEILNFFTKPVKLDFEKDIIMSQIEKKKVYVYQSTEYVKDIGTPDRIKSVISDIKNDVIKGRSLKRKQKAVFLDRDGTINVLKGFLKKTEDFELLPGVAEAIKKLNGSQYITIVATNQPVIARGECTWEELEEIHKKMETVLGRQNAYIDDLFFCPHHPNKGYEGEVLELKIDCECRKPKIGMFIDAAKKYNIDLSQSWYIGDTTVDIQAGINAGMRTILLKTGEAGQDGNYNVVPTAIAENLYKAVEYLLAI